jgi:hypothetical protein
MHIVFPNQPKTAQVDESETGEIVSLFEVPPATLIAFFSFLMLEIPRAQAAEGFLEDTHIVSGVRAIRGRRSRPIRFLYRSARRSV